MAHVLLLTELLSREDEAYRIDNLCRCNVVVSFRVWDLDTGVIRQLLRGHMGPVWCMVYDPASGRIASGSEDYTVR